jgi:hypothetical protein
MSCNWEQYLNDKGNRRNMLHFKALTPAMLQIEEAHRNHIYRVLVGSCLSRGRGCMREAQ